jgi:hypothetical protein
MQTRTLCLLIVLCISTSTWVQAAELDAAVTWSCRPHQGVLVIHYSPSLADARPEVQKENPLVFYSLLILDKDQTTVEDTKSQEIVCRLKKDKFEVTFEPGAPNPNLLGACGAAVTGLVTINRNGSVLMDQKEFEALDCTERKHYIEKIIFKDGSVKPEIVYGNYDEE